MSFARPSLDTLKTRILADFESRLDLAGKPLRRSVVRVMAYVFAGVAHGLYGFLEYLGDQLFPDVSADAYLIRQASVYGITKTAASYATGTVTITGTNGTVIPAGTILVRSDGITYETDAEVTIAGGEAEVDITAVEAGSDSTVEGSLELSFESPIAGADSTVGVDFSLVDGVDEETTEELRERLLERIRRSPHGGAPGDFVAWAKEVAGVTRAWEEPLANGAGTVVLRFVRDNDEDYAPSPGEVAEVQAYLDTVAPVTCEVTVVAPDNVLMDFTVSITPDTAAVRAALEAELEDLFLRRAEPGGTILLSEIRTTIGNTAGLTDYTLTVPSADATHDTNELAGLGTVTYV